MEELRKRLEDAELIFRHYDDGMGPWYEDSQDIWYVDKENGIVVLEYCNAVLDPVLYFYRIEDLVLVAAYNCNVFEDCVVNYLLEKEDNELPW